MKTAYIQVPYKMTPSQQAKKEGLKSLSQVSDMTNTSPQTLTNWARDKPALFRAVLAGCKSILDKEGNNG